MSRAPGVAAGLRRGLAGLPPPAILAMIYAGTILSGSALLLLPVSRTAPLAPLDALFTATSAVTVTGLVVVDTGTAFTRFGQAVILLLIQLGGLGLMTIAALVAQALGLPLGLRGQVYLRDDLKQAGMSGLGPLVRTVVVVALIAEVVGALVMAPAFVAEAGWSVGLWNALFHSISAFNNAGFSTYGDSLVRFATNELVIITVSLLIVFGGLGYGVVRELWRERRPRRWTLHTKLMLSGTVVLLVWSSAMFAALEWSNPATLGLHGGVEAKLLVSVFQGVTTRTAGFNSVDIGALHDGTALMFISLMLIGGGPASTAGGIKVTTFIVLLLAMVAFLRRRSEIAVFGRSIGTEQMMKAAAVVAMSVLVVFAATFLVVVFQGDDDFLAIAFEVASAFGTTGLSRNFTGELTDPSRAVLIVVMFLGRVGPLTLGVFLTTRSRPRVRRPAGEIVLG